jgi:methanethiol S-methyltransferase
MLLKHLILAFLWVAYCIIHSVLASSQIKGTLKRRMGNYFRYYRFIYTIFAFTGLIAIIIYQLSIKAIPLFKKIPFVQIGGAVISLAGFFIMGLCIVNYFSQVSGVRSLTDNEYELKPIQKNIHKHVRHPLYMGTFLFIWGLLPVFPVLSLLITNFIITVYTLIGIQFEEKKLVSEFGDSYKVYKKTVPKIIPRFTK